MKVALVTGVAGGIGFATAELLLKNGVAVVGMDVVSDMPKKLEGNFTYFKGDLSNKESRENYVKTVLDRFGKIDILVNVAGVAPKVRNDILEMTEESYDFVMNINTKGTLFLTQLVANVMKEKRTGSIVNISSMSGYTSSPNRGEYCISKAGVTMITTLFADRLAEYGILVNEIRPGIIATGMTDKVKAKYDDLIEDGLLPIKRWGKSEDVAKAVWTLCNGSLPYVTGQSIDVDGGFHIRRL
ncbi:MAG: 3-ketoacyl-ACP reductase [Lachnospiraceae bacterium]|nr:3-ketoacyl-ACP reductase [Lachnospiraceae bacterium]